MSIFCFQVYNGWLTYKGNDFIINFFSFVAEKDLEIEFQLPTLTHIGGAGESLTLNEIIKRLEVSGIREKLVWKRVNGVYHPIHITGFPQTLDNLENTVFWGKLMENLETHLTQ